MRVTPVRVAALLSGLCLVSCSDGDQKSCVVETVAEVKLLSGIWRPTVEASLDGQKVAMLVDTGTDTSIVTPQAVDRFNLMPADGNPRMRLGGIGGMDDAPVVVLRHLQLGQGHSSNLDLPVSTSLHGSIDGIPLIGLFGADFMVNYDVDVDVPDHHFALRSLHQCGREIAPFDGPYFEVPFRLEATKIRLDIKVDNVPVEAVLDTGAPHTLIDLADARRIGLTHDALAADRVYRAKGDAMDQADMTVHRFDSLEVGAERFNHFRFAVADTYTGVSLLGDDFFAHNRVWISYPRQMLYIQPAANDAIIHQDGTPAAK